MYYPIMDWYSIWVQSYQEHKVRIFLFSRKIFVFRKSKKPRLNCNKHGKLKSYPIDLMTTRRINETDSRRHVSAATRKEMREGGKTNQTETLANSGIRPQLK